MVDTGRRLVRGGPEPIRIFPKPDPIRVVVGKCLVDADYAQIENRLLCSLCDSRNKPVKTRSMLMYVFPFTPWLKTHGKQRKRLRWQQQIRFVSQWERIRRKNMRRASHDV